jgi:phosphotransferase system HPr (HPr) family protein
MIKKDVVVKVLTGLHARPAANLVKLANTFKADIFLYHNNIKVNAKDIWDVLNNGIESGDPLIVECNGIDEIEATNKICSFIDNDEVQ